MFPAKIVMAAHPVSDAGTAAIEGMSPMFQAIQQHKTLDDARAEPLPPSGPSEIVAGACGDTMPHDSAHQESTLSKPQTADDESKLVSGNDGEDLPMAGATSEQRVHLAEVGAILATALDDAPSTGGTDPHMAVPPDVLDGVREACGDEGGKAADLPQNSVDWFAEVVAALDPQLTAAAGQMVSVFHDSSTDLQESYSSMSGQVLFVVENKRFPPRSPAAPLILRHAAMHRISLATIQVI